MSTWKPRSLKLHLKRLLNNEELKDYEEEELNELRENTEELTEHEFNALFEAVYLCLSHSTSRYRVRKAAEKIRKGDLSV